MLAGVAETCREPLAQHDLRRTRPLVLSRERPAERRARAEHLEVACRDGQHRHSNGLAASREVGPLGGERIGARHAVEGACPLPVLGQFGSGEESLALAGEDSHEAVRLAVRKRLQQHTAHHREDRGGRAERRSQNGDGGEGEPRGARQCTDREADLVRHLVGPRSHSEPPGDRVSRLGRRRAGRRWSCVPAARRNVAPGVTSIQTATEAPSASAPEGLGHPPSRCPCCRRPFSGRTGTSRRARLWG